MEILDVLIIGAGPHALTLASLLTRPDLDQDQDQDREPDPNPGQDSPLCPSSPDPETSKRQNTCRRRTKRKVTKGGTPEEKPTRSTMSAGAAGPPLSLAVVDSYGKWAALWESQFTALEIPHLRSHALVHTDARNKRALQEFVREHGRGAELHGLPERAYILDENAFFSDTRLGRKERKRLPVSSTVKKSPALSLPGTRLSVDFFRDQVRRHGLDRLLVKGTATLVRPVSRDAGAGRRAKHFDVCLADGSVLRARRVVMATGPTRAQMANVPPWVSDIAESYPEERLRHTVQLMHPKRENQGGGTSPAEGQRVMVVGGGLTSAHVVAIALQRGASHVTWVMRKHLQLKQFDVGDVETLVGRYSHVEHGVKMDGRAYLRQFYGERSLHKRLAMIRQARKGGAVTPEAYIHLRPFISEGRVDVKTYCQVTEARWCYRSQAWSLSLSSGDRWAGDAIWLATGCKLDVRQDPLLSEVMREFPIQAIDGLPCVSESLRWAEGCPVYLMGQYAALQVGPHAINLAGGQAASARIAGDILRGEAVAGDSGKSRAEEYVRQMQGLLWL